VRDSTNSQRNQPREVVTRESDDCPSPGFIFIHCGDNEDAVMKALRVLLATHTGEQMGGRTDAS
jgi:hypothetical protein